MTIVTAHLHPAAARLAALVIAAALGAAPALAHDHLVPEGSIIGDAALWPQYDAMVRAVLSDAYAQGVVARAIIQPPDAPETATGIEQQGGRYRVFALQADTQLWSYETLRRMKTDGTPSDTWSALAHTLPRDWRDVTVVRHDAVLDAALAQRILALWTAVLLETRYVRPGEDPVTVLGPMFHFSGLGEWQFLAGATSSPPKGSAPSLLEDIAVAMGDYARAPDDASRTELEHRVAALEDRLRKNSK